MWELTDEQEEMAIEMINSCTDEEFNEWYEEQLNA